MTSATVWRQPRGSAIGPRFAWKALPNPTLAPALAPALALALALILARGHTLAARWGQRAPKPATACNSLQLLTLALALTPTPPPAPAPTSTSTPTPTPTPNP
jgi:hypothetical protein